MNTPSNDPVPVLGSRSSLVDGNLTLYFETDVNRKAYQNLSLNHPNLYLPFEATDDNDHGGWKTRVVTL